MQKTVADMLTSESWHFLRHVLQLLLETNHAFQWLLLFVALGALLILFPTFPWIIFGCSLKTCPLCFLLGPMLLQSSTYMVFLSPTVVKLLAAKTQKSPNNQPHCET